MKWYWEKRANDEYTPPQISTFLQGWDSAKADIESPLDPSKEVFVRELVQNFVDASRDRIAAKTKPKLTFRFLAFGGKEATRISSALDLSSISGHHANIDNPDEMRLPESDITSGNLASVNLLVVTENGTSGMYGHWDRSSKAVDHNGNLIQQKMRDALLATVRGSAGSGLGSFGEGKKAVIGISRCRALFAYTCFDGATSENGASRRLMGGIYWQNHVVKGERYSGFAMMGGESSPGESRPRPFEDEAADAEIRALALPGLEVRDSSNSEEFGTTLVFVDPNIAPAEVALAIKRNWWPLLEDDSVDFEIFDVDGNVCAIPNPAELEPFISAYHAMESIKVENWEAADAGAAFSIAQIKSAREPHMPVGTLKLSIDLRPAIGWSQAEPETNWSLVALIRNGMLISYQHFPRAKRTPAPYVRGVFLVNSGEHPEAEKLLRRTEPPLHNKWQWQGQELEAKAKALANEVYSTVTASVEGFRQEYISASSKQEFALELFSENLALPGGKTKMDPVDPVSPPSSPTPWSMLSDEATVVDHKDGRRVAKASRSIKLSSHETESHRVRVTVGWQILEDGVWVDAYESLVTSPIEAPEGFTSVKGTFNEFEGLVTDTPSIFFWTSAPYRDLWTLRPFMTVTSLVLKTDDGLAE